MKIVIVSPVFWPATIYGGPVFTMAALVKALARRGEDVTVITGNLGNEGKIDAEVGEVLDFHGARLIYLNQRRTPPYGPLEELELFLDREARDAQILHISSTLTRTSWQAMRWADKNHLPYVVTTRGHLMRRNKWKDLKKLIAVNILLKDYLRKAVFLQATSLLEAEELTHYGFKNVEIIPHGVDIPDLLLERRKARSEWGIDDDELVLVSLGRIHPVKGLELLIKALGNLKNSDLIPKLLIAGLGDQNYLWELKELIKQEDIVSQCRFVGQVAGDQKWSLLRAGDLFVHLSTGESFGLAIGEALGAGLPVLIGESCGWEAVEELGFGRRVPRTLAAVVSGLDGLLADKNQLRAMGDKVSVWVSSNYQWSKIADEMADLYKLAKANNV